MLPRTSKFAFETNPRHDFGKMPKNMKNQRFAPVSIKVISAVVSTRGAQEEELATIVGHADLEELLRGTPYPRFAHGQFRDTLDLQQA